WPTCLDFVDALRAAGEAAPERPAAEPSHPLHALNRLLGELQAALQGDGRDEPGVPAEAAGDALHARFSANLAADAERRAREALRQQWNGQPVRQHEGLYAFRVSVPSNFWQRCIGRQPGLSVVVRLSRPNVPGATATEITVHVRPNSCTPEQGAQLLRQTGPL